MFKRFQKQGNNCLLVRIFQGFRLNAKIIVAVNDAHVVESSGFWPRGAFSCRPWLIARSDDAKYGDEDWESKDDGRD